MYKKKFLIIILPIVIALSVIISMNFIIDPFHIIHKTKFNKGFSEQQRLQNAGIIKHFLVGKGYNSIVVGTSLTECFYSPYIDERIDGWKTLKLSMSGSSGNEQVKTIEYVLEKEDIKNVILEARHFVITDFKSRLKEYLYDDNIFNDINYLTSHKVLKFYLVKERVEKIEDRNNWCPPNQHLFKNYNSEVNLDKLAKKLDKKRKDFNYKEKHINKDVYNKYVELFNKYPDVNFHVVSPPKSLFSLVKQSTELDYLKDIALFFSRFNNVKFYGFDNVYKITADLANYKDDHHYKAWVNEYMIDSIANNEHELDKNNIDEYIKDVVEKVKTYKVCSSGKCY